MAVLASGVALGAHARHRPEALRELALELLPPFLAEAFPDLPGVLDAPLELRLDALEGRLLGLDRTLGALDVLLRALLELLVLTLEIVLEILVRALEALLLLFGLALQLGLEALALLLQGALRLLMGALYLGFLALQGREGALLGLRSLALRAFLRPAGLGGRALLLAPGLGHLAFEGA